MPGLFSRFRKPTPEPEPVPAAAPGGSNPGLGHEGTHTLQNQGDAPSLQDGGEFVNKLTSPELNGEGNDVAIETLELSHEGLELEGEDAAGVDVKYTMFKADGTPVAADGDAPDFQDALITETTLPKLDAADPLPDGPDGLAADGQDGSGEYNSFEAWPNKWYVPELDSDSSAVPPIPPDDPEEMTTLEPIAEAKETTGAITFLDADRKTELSDDDGDADPDDLI